MYRQGWSNPPQATKRKKGKAMRSTAECIQLYTLEEAEKVISYRNKRAIRRKYQALKQKLIFKSISLGCIILSLIALIAVDFDNGGALLGILIGLMGLVIPFNAEIRW